MTCDDAFDRMTSERRLSAEVREHLENCPRCREMHETLSPALEALDPDLRDCNSSPWLSGAQASSEAVALARTVAAELTRGAITTRRWERVVAGMRYVAVLFVGVALGSLALIVMEPRIPGRESSLPADACTRSLINSSTDAAALVRTCVACHAKRVSLIDVPRSPAMEDRNALDQLHRHASARGTATRLAESLMTNSLHGLPADRVEVASGRNGVAVMRCPDANVFAKVTAAASSGFRCALSISAGIPYREPC